MKKFIKKIMPTIFVLGLFLISGGLVFAATPGYISTSATNITANSAVLTSVFNPSGLNTNTWFEVQNVGNQLGYKNIGNGNSSVSNNYSLTGLNASQTYSYRGVAENSTGTTYGPWKTFTTLSNNIGTPTNTGDTTPRIAFWPGKVNQHINSNGQWVSDPDGKSGGHSYTMYANDYGGRELAYCQKWYPTATSINNYKMETITTWKRASQYEQSNYTKTVMSMECVSGNNPTYLPSVNLTANPTSVSYGGTTYLNWNVNNATSCYASGGWSGNKNANSGNQSIGNLIYDQTFTLTCTGQGGTASDTVHVNVGNEPIDYLIPTVSLSANPTSVDYGDNTYLNWNVNNATSCYASGDWSGNKNSNNGNQTIYDLTHDKTFTLTCTGQGGTASDSVHVNVGNYNYDNEPNVITRSASSIDEDSARLNGEVSANDSDYVKAWFEWGDDRDMDNRTRKVNYGSVEDEDYSYNLRGLDENTTYYFRAVAQNEEGETVYGSRRSFKTDDNGNCSNCSNDDLYVTTYSATNVANNSARLNGYLSIENNNDYATKWFEYGTSGNYLSYKTNKTHEYNSDNFNQMVYNLKSNTTYYYRAVARSNNNTEYGNVLSFRTGGNSYNNTCNNGINCKPTVITTLATNVGYTSARLNGYALVKGGISTNGYFQYGQTTSLGNTTNSKYIGSSPSIPYYHSLFGLKSNTTYYYRAVVTNQYGTSYGDIQTFRTKKYSTNTNTNTTTTRTEIIYREVIPVTNLITTNTIGYGVSQPSLVLLDINRNNEIVNRGSIFEYVLNYKNVSSEHLRDLVLRVMLPKELNFISASRGYFSEENNTLVINIEDLYPQEEGSVVVRVSVRNNAELSRTIVTTGNMVYTIVNTNSQEEVFAYSKNVINNENENTALVGTALFGSGFFPSTLIGWLILLLTILLIVLAIRIAYKRTYTKVVNNNNHTM